MKKTNKISRGGRGSTDPKKGAVLLIAILVASVALAVGFGVYNRTYKELLFASFWKQTQIAFASADTGLECALYWELHPATPATCFGNQTVTGLSWPSPDMFGSFEKDIDTNGPCVKVTIAWNALLSATTTESKGYNASCAVVNAGTNPRIVERGLGFSL